MRLPLPLAAIAAILAGPVLAADPPKDAGVDIVPPGAFAFVTVRVSDLSTVEALKPVKEALAGLEKVEGSFDKLVGVPVADMDRVTLFWPAVPADDAGTAPVVVITTRAPFNEARVLKTLKARPIVQKLTPHGPAVEPYAPGAPKATVPATGAAPVRVGPPGSAAPPPVRPGAPPSKGPGGPGFNARLGDEPADPKPARAAPPADKDAAPSAGPDLYLLEGTFAAVYLVDDRTLVFLPRADRGGIVTYFALVGQLLRRKADGPLADALAEAGQHTLSAGLRVHQLEGLFRDELPRELVPFHSLLRAQVAVITMDAGPKMTVTARLTFADAGLARRAAPVLSTLIQTATDFMVELRKRADKESEWGPVAIPLIDLASAALDKAEVKADGSIVTARVEAEIGPAVAKALAALPAVAEAASTKMKTMNNLKQIGLAMHNYHDVYGHFPTDIVGPTGKPILSWRVAILPFIEQDNLFRQIDMSKAWDDPVNAKLLAKMPDVFRVYGRDAKDKNATFFQIPTSPRLPNGPRPFQVPGTGIRFADITDGTSNTIMVVEAADAVPWAKPGDLTFDPTQPPKVGSPDRKWFFAGIADGSVRTFNRSKLSDDQLRALMTINGGEVVDIRP